MTTATAKGVSNKARRHAGTKARSGKRGHGIRVVEGDDGQSAQRKARMANQEAAARDAGEIQDDEAYVPTELEERDPIPWGVPAVEPVKSGSDSLLPIDNISPSPLNPRKHFDQGKLQELADSIRREGLLQPVVVRINPREHGFELVAGERRWRASKMAGLTEIPGRVIEIDDERMVELMMVENLQRDDLNPLEEARGYRALIDSAPSKHSAESIAARVGKSPKWVWDTMKLLDLVPEAQGYLEAGHITAAHGVLIARLKPEDQRRCTKLPDSNDWDRATHGLWQKEDSLRLFSEEELKAIKASEDPVVKRRLKAVSTRELQEWISRHVRMRVADAAAGDPLLFGDDLAIVEAAEAEPGRGKKVVPITFEFACPPFAKGNERTYGIRSWKRADGIKGKTCSHSVIGEVIAGPRQGTALRVCIAKEKCIVHWAQHVKAKAAAAKRRAAAEARVARVATKKTAEAQEKERKRVAEQEAREAKRREQEAAKAEALAGVRAAALPEVKEAVARSIEKAPIAKVLSKLEYRCVRGELTFDDRFLREAQKLIEGAGADAWCRRALLADMLNGAEYQYGSDDVEALAKEADFGGGIPAILKKHEEALKPKPEAKAEKKGNAKGAKAAKPKAKKAKGKRGGK